MVPPRDDDARTTDGDDAELSRRRFLQATGAAAAGTVLLGAGCEADDSEGAPTPGAADTVDAGGDTAGGGEPDTGAGPDGAPSEPEPMPRPEASVTIMKGPWVMALPSGGVAVRFETIEDVAVPVRLEVEGEDGPLDLEPTRGDVVYSQTVPIEALEAPEDVIRDVAGAYTLHTVVIEDLPPGARCTWHVATEPVDVGEAEETVVSGTFKTSPAPDAPPSAPGEPVATFGWVSDTMYPYSLDTAPVLASLAPDVMLHGGDIQYVSGLVDTWNTYFHNFGTSMRQSLSAWCVGNHEFEYGDAASGEYDEYYVQLLAPPDPTSPAASYRAFTYAGVRVVMLDSEADYSETNLDDPEGAQRQWLAGELAASSADPAVRAIVVCFHRPYLTFGKTGMRRHWFEWMHPLFLEHGVSLVLTGHNHAFERFEVDGMTYVTDGGGGALSYSISEQIDEGLISDEELAWRKAADRSYGVTHLAFFEDGSMEIRRHQAPDGEVLDSVTVPPRQGR